MDILIENILEIALDALPGESEHHYNALQAIVDVIENHKKFEIKRKQQISENQADRYPDDRYKKQLYEGDNCPIFLQGRCIACGKDIWTDEPHNSIAGGKVFHFGECADMRNWKRTDG